MKLKILLVEDNQDDALLILRTIRQVGYEIIHQQVATAAEMEIALEQPNLGAARHWICAREKAWIYPLLSFRAQSAKVPP
jgi:hypothetical protein